MLYARIHCTIQWPLKYICVNRNIVMFNSAINIIFLWLTKTGLSTRINKPKIVYTDYKKKPFYDGTQLTPELSNASGPFLHLSVIKSITCLLLIAEQQWWQSAKCTTVHYNVGIKTIRHLFFNTLSKVVWFLSSLVKFS